MTSGPPVRSLVAMTEHQTLAALRDAQAARAAMRRRMLMPMATVVLGTVVFVAARKQPGLGLHGASLAFSLALGGLLVGVLGTRQALFTHRAPRRVFLPLIVLLLASSAVLVWLQPDGPGGAGFIAVLALVVGARVIQHRAGFTLLAAGCLAVLVAVVLTGKHTDRTPTLVSLAVNAVPFLVFFWVVMLFWRIRQQEEQTECLLLELEETRGAELRAATLAERQRLARDMHDVLAHSLSGLMVQLEAARLLTRTDPADARLPGTIDRAHQLARNGLAEARQAIGMLRGDELPDPEALPALAAAFASDTGIPCDFSAAGTPRELAPEVRLALYRVTQEALTNVRKHAGNPDRVDVRLDYRRGEVVLEIEDVGTSPPPSPGSGYGIAGMRERAELLGGTLVATPADGGFLVRLRVPA